MKKGTLSLIFVLLATLTFSQSTNVAGTYNALKSGYLDKAKKYIDLAIQNEQTKGQAKTWFFRGNVYLGIAMSDEKSKYKVLDTNAIQVAYDSYQKALALDPTIMHDQLNPSSPMQGIIYCGGQFYNKGVEAFQKKDIAGALDKFEMAKKVYTIGGQKDSLATFGAALCAMQLKDNKKAKTNLEDLVKMGYKQAEVFHQLAAIYKSEGDTNKAVAAIAKGRKIFPSDLSLIIDDINILLAKGKNKDAQDLLDIAVAKDPNNPILYYNIGVNMDEFGNFEQAEKSYLKAIKIKADYFDAYYNLGALYINTSLAVKKELDAVPISETAKYDQLKAKYDSLLLKALPTLEAAEKLNPKDYSTLFILKQLYALKSDMVKVKEVEEKIKNIKPNNSGNNINDIKVGMLKQDVLRILGNPDNISKTTTSSGATELLFYNNFKVSINIDEGGKVDYIHEIK